MNEAFFDVLVVGAGHAGLCASYYLKQHHISHLIFERGKTGNSWRSQRWDSFRVNSPNWLNELPGGSQLPQKEGFCSATAFADNMKKYVDNHQLPVVENARVISIEQTGDIPRFKVKVQHAKSLRDYYCNAVVVASGDMNEKKIPAFADAIEADVEQLHAAEYRNATELPDGAVLVVGGGQSGCQIAEDLADSGKKVFLSTSMVARIPRRYRDRDIHDWLIDMKFFDARKEQVNDPVLLNLKAPQLTGTGAGNKTISLQSLSKKGISILGRLEDAVRETLFFQDNATAHVKFADLFSEKIKLMIDEYILKNRLATAAPVEDLEDLADPDASCIASIASINLRESRIRSIIWATGFTGDFSYLRLPIFDATGSVKQEDGVAVGVPGLYFLGLPWMRARKSILLFGIKEDASFICEKLFAELPGNMPARSSSHAASHS